MEEQIRIERLSYGNAGIGHTAEGKTIFVDKTAPGDLVLAAITEDKGRFCRGTISTLLEASPCRISAPCPYYESCGGCPWQHLQYETQLEAKREAVLSSLIHTAHFKKEHAEELVSSCKASKRELGYRNKLEFGTTMDAQGNFILGFHKEGTPTLSTPDSCLMAHKPLAGSPKALRGSLRYAQGNLDLGIFRVGVRSSLRTHDLEVALWTKPGAFPRARVAQTLKSALRPTSIVRIIADPGKARKVKNVEVLDGKGYWEERLGDTLFKTSAPSFFQVNTAQAEVLVDEVVSGLSLDDSMTVADLYAGGGTFSIALAEKVDTVLAIESASTSVKDLRRNAEINQVYVEVIGGDSARELPQLGHLDALVVDPPRAGLAPGVVESIAKANPKRVAYVSCDPATWARDVTRFSDCGYTLISALPVDLFPQTFHVEIVSFFEK